MILKAVPSMRHFAVTLFAIMAASAAFAQESTAPVNLNPSGWQTFTWSGTCNAVAFPESAPVQALDSEKAYISIRHNPKEGSRDAISFVSGLGSTEGVSGRVDVDGKIYDLLVYKGAGFVSAGEREASLLANMLAGADLRVTWITPESMVNQDYKVTGLDQAKRIIDTGCYPPAG